MSILTEGQSAVRCPFLLKMTCNDVSILRMTCNDVSILRMTCNDVSILTEDDL